MGAALKAKCGEQPGGCTLVGAAAMAEVIERRNRAEPGAAAAARGRVPPPGAAAGCMYTDEGPGSTVGAYHLLTIVHSLHKSSVLTQLFYLLLSLKRPR
jgi:hypothetical protein